MMKIINISKDQSGRLMIVRILRGGGEPDINLKMRGRHTIGHLLARMRRHVHIEPQEAIFLFTPEGISYPNSKLLSELKQPIVFKMLKENSFGALSRMFVSANIKAQNNIFIVRITYSYYGIYHYDDVTTHETLESAKDHVLTKRCGGHLVVE